VMWRFCWRRGENRRRPSIDNLPTAIYNSHRRSTFIPGRSRGGSGMRSSGEQMRDRIVEAIDELTSENNRPPTNRELGEFLGGKSTGHIDYHLRILKDRGVINHDAKKSRGISLAGGASLPDGYRVPLMGTIAAGSPIDAVQTPDEYVIVPSNIASGSNRSDLFAL